MNGASLKYSWLTYRRDQLWFPLAFFALFVVITLIMPNPAIRFTLARAYLGFIVPLIGGIMASYAVLDDPAIELRFSTPVRAEQILLARVGLIVIVQAVCALAFQLFALALKIDLSRLGNVVDVQWIWLLPTLVLAALGIAGSLAGAQTVVGAFLVGTVWLVELMMKSWFELNAKYAFLFLGVFTPGHPDLVLSRSALAAAAVALLCLSWVLLHRQERYI